VLGLRPFTAKAEILPEQVIGRGLRIMTGVSPDRTQTLEVLGTSNLLNVLRDQLEAEGVGVKTVKGSPALPVIIEPVLERAPYDIAIPLTKPRLSHDIRKLAELDPEKLGPIFEQPDLLNQFRLELKIEFATTETRVHETEIRFEPGPTHEILASITNRVMDQAKLTNRFAELYPIIRSYLAGRCFGRAVDLEDIRVRTHLSRFEIQEAIVKYLAREISKLTIERRSIEFEMAHFKLSGTKPFSWRRNLPPLVCKRTIFNFVATYNDYERRFAQFLDSAPDVLRFAALGTTEQGESGTRFRVDYIKPSGAIGFYHPDWVVAQKEGKTEVNWIVETKGRVWESTAAKDEAIDDWCQRVAELTKLAWRYVRVDQRQFDGGKPATFAEAVSSAR